MDPLLGSVHALLVTGRSPHSAVKLQLDKYVKALQDMKIQVEMDDSAAGQLVRSAYNPAMGARPLKRLLERVVMTSLSRLV